MDDITSEALGELDTFVRRDGGRLIMMTGSRRFAMLAPTLIHVDEDTDYDHIMDIAQSADLQREFPGWEEVMFLDTAYDRHPEQRHLGLIGKGMVQIILTDDMYLARRVYDSISPTEYFQFMWKSAPHQMFDGDEIGEIWAHRYRLMMETK